MLNQPHFYDQFWPAPVVGDELPPDISEIEYPVRKESVWVNGKNGHRYEGMVLTVFNDGMAKVAIRDPQACRGIYVGRWPVTALELR